MPFVQRVVQPNYLSRTTLFSEDGKPLVKDQELEAVTNNTLSNALRQLASLASIADDIFTELSQHLQEVARRSETLKTRIKCVEDKVNNYDPKTVTVPESDICTFALLKNHYAANITPQTNLFTSESRPKALRELYEAANKTPVHLMRQMDRWRRDGHRTSRFFLCTPVLGEKRRKIRNIDIETRMPASIKDLRRWTSSEALGDVTVAPDCPNRIIPNVTLTDVEVTDGIASDDEPIDHKLPSPEEQLQVVALKFPAEIVRVDVSGKSFDRMSIQRRSLLTGKPEELQRTRTRTRKPRSRRRNTLAGTDQKEIREALTAAESPTSSPAAEPDKIVGRSKSSDLLRPFKRDSPENKKSHFNTLKQWGQWGKNRYDRFMNKACSSSPEATKTDDIDDFNLYETVTMKRKRSVEKHRSPSVSSSEKSTINIAVKLRETSAQSRLKRFGSKEEPPHSSSGNWSASSIGSEFTSTTQPKSTTSAATSINSLNQPNSVPSRRRFNINTSTSSSVTSEGTLTPDIIHDLHEDGETSSVYSCDTEGYYTSFHMDSGLKTLKEEDLPCTPLHSTSAVCSLTAENEYELFGKGSTSTTTSSAGTVCTTLMASDSSRSLNKCPAVPERKSSLPKYSKDSDSPESSLERTGTVKRSPASNKANVVAIVHKGDVSPDSGHNTSSSPIESANSPNGIRSGSEFEFSESSDMEGPERIERIRIKTTINSSRIPSMCVITPQQSDDESTNSDKENDDDNKKRKVLNTGYATLESIQNEVLDVNKNSKILRAPSPSGGTVTVMPDNSKPQQPIIKATLLPLNNMLGKIKNNLANLTRKDKSPNRLPQEDNGDYVTLADVRNNNEKAPIYSNVIKNNVTTNNNNNNKIRETEYVSLDELPCNANENNENSLERTKRQGARVTLDAEGKVVYSSDSLKRKTSNSTFEPGPFVKLATGFTQSPVPIHRVPKTRPLSPSMVIRAGNEVVHRIAPSTIVAPAVNAKSAGQLRGAYVHVQDTIRPAQDQDRVPTLSQNQTPVEMHQNYRSLEQRGKYHQPVQKPPAFYQTLPAKKSQYFLQDPERSVTPDITRGLERNKQVYNFHEPPDWNLLNQKIGIPVKLPEVPSGSQFAHISPHKSSIDSVDSIKISPIDPRNSVGFQSSTPSNKTAVNLENLLSSPKKSTMSNEELYAVIHKSKKKMNIQTEEVSPVKINDKSRSRLSWSPSKGEYVDFNTDIDNLSPPNSSKTRQSWACEPKKNVQTSRMDFKKLLLQKSSVLSTPPKKLSAVEQLKLSRNQIQNKSSQQPINILELSGSPRNLNRKFNNDPVIKPTPKLMSPRSQWRFANPRTDVLSSTILEDCREDESPNNSLEKHKESPKPSPISYPSVQERIQSQRANFFNVLPKDTQESKNAARPALETAF